MPFLGSKYAKMLLRPGLWPGPRWRSLQRSPRHPSWIKGGLLLRGGGGEVKRKGREGKGRGGERKGEEGKGGEERRRGCCAPPFSNSWISPCSSIVEMNIIKVVLSHFCCRTTVQSVSVSVSSQAGDSSSQADSTKHIFSKPERSTGTAQSPVPVERQEEKAKRRERTWGSWGGEWTACPSSRTGGLRARCKFPQRGPGGAPAAEGFSCIQENPSCIQENPCCIHLA